MEKTKKNDGQSIRGTYSLIARKLGCTPKYVSMVLRGKMGKYPDRKTNTVKQIRVVAAEIEEMFEPQSL